MKTKVIFEHNGELDVTNFEDKMRKLSEEKNREWFYDEFTFNDYGDDQGEIIISYKNPELAFPHANLMQTEISLLNDSSLQIKEIKDIR
ncbi:hypothetical protein [Virgibacillus siamensis]|uniref:hypothetical protein n=1 Tax=Virgibacillus siamensis TaxID=480071 RepID=UPI000985211A|nr:hypothetical protein [Virgibacillus siamensis]